MTDEERLRRVKSHLEEIGYYSPQAQLERGIREIGATLVSYSIIWAEFNDRRKQIEEETEKRVSEALKLYRNANHNVSNYQSLELYKNLAAESSNLKKEFLSVLRSSFESAITASCRVDN